MRVAGLDGHDEGRDFDDDGGFICWNEMPSLSHWSLVSFLSNSCILSFFRLNAL